ncbi:MAG: sigma-54 dependent transcriptional regulator [Candidatus Magnetoovum sp. WYHC-5]|nr:sigma-54 dependent transcriptional regulator [Candidatus Magnetoovum sp. WYHC-5]
MKRKSFHKLIGESQAMQELYNMIEKVSDSDTTVLLDGESGTGKELVAKAIHHYSRRNTKNFVPVNCGAIPKDLLESELFGHEKGAFTGAVTTRVGRFELADGGTILLDEIGELHPSLQVKLLRVLQEKEFERVGGTKTIKVDVRILAATNKNLEVAAKDGDFREDLFYRLNVIPLHLPPLRAKKEDIPVLLEHFMNVFCQKKGVKPLKVSAETLQYILNYDWPGNVRELEALVERVVVLSDGDEVGIANLPARFTSNANKTSSHNMPKDIAALIKLPPEGLDLNAMLESVEKNLILQAMELAAGVKSKAAALLGLNRTTFLEKLKKRGLDAKAADPSPFQ